MEHEEAKGKLYRCCLGNVMISDELLAEFDRLNEIIKNQSTIINSCGERGATLQSWLDRISEPIKEWLKSIPPDSKSWDEHKTSYAFKSMATIQAYLDSQSKQPSSGHRCSDGKIHTAQQEDCPICNPPKSNPCDSCQHWDCCEGCLEKIQDEPKCEHKNIHDGVKWVYGKQWCLDCKQWIPLYDSQQDLVEKYFLRRTNG